MSESNGQANCRFRRRLAEVVMRLDRAGGVRASYERKCEADFDLLAVEEELDHVSQAEAAPIQAEIERLDAQYHLGGWQIDRLKLVHRMPVAIQPAMEAGLLHGDWSLLRRAVGDAPELAIGVVRVVSGVERTGLGEGSGSDDEIALIFAEVRDRLASVHITEGS